MPADDLVLNVRQIAQYTPSGNAPSGAALLMQLAGIGSGYASISPQALVATALATGGDMAIGGKLSAQAFAGGSAQFSNAAVNLFSAQKACIVDFAATWGTIGGLTIATVADLAALRETSVWSFEGRVGPVCLWLQDILRAGGAPNFSPVFGGEPRAPTPPPSSSSSRLATTAWVQRNFVEGVTNLLADHPFVFTFNGRSGDIVLTEDDILAAGGGEIFDSPVFTGIPIAPTAAPGTNTDQIATTAFVNAAISSSTLFAPLDSPAFTGYATAPTAAPGSSTGQLATTAFVMAAVAASVAGVATFNGRTGNVLLSNADITEAGGALLVSPVFTGTPSGPTAAPGTTTTQFATTAFVMAAVGGVGVESFNGRVGNITLSTADVTGAGGAPIASAALTGVPTAPTAAPGVATTQLATTAFVMAAINTGGVTSFNNRSGAVTLSSADISAAGGATLVSPVFTGIPIAPTAAPTTTTNQIATCAFVAAAISGSVASFNGRVGSVTLTAADISAAGGAAIASPHFTGTPTAPTASAGDNSTTLATTAYVTAAIGASTGVATFNGRAGPVTLIAADVSAAGGALISSPTFTGTPSGPTAAAGTNTTQLATTAYVMNAISAGGGVLSFNGRAGAVTLTAADLNAAGGPYLPLAGGTLTGPLIGTTGNFTGAVVALGGSIGTGGGFSQVSLNSAAGATQGSLAWNSANGTVIVSNNALGGGGALASQLTLQADSNLIWNGVNAYKPGGGVWATSSDARTKDVHGDYTAGLEEIAQITPILYSYRGNDTPTRDGESTHKNAAETSHQFVGLVAQDIEWIFPEMVTKSPGFIHGEPVDDLRSVDATPLVFALVNAVKTLAARIETLEQRMAT
jgi:endosialidase-like protein